ncbi:MAG: family 20 glycosylhydrolase [Proteobacteria bacterium]|nr:family 20 glycosylhydrolase [Pseudomonadota bacterium]
MRTKFAVVLAGCLLPFGAWAASAPIDVIPQPRHVEAGTGAFVLHSRERIAAPDDARAQEIAGFLRDAMHRQTGGEWIVGKADAGQARIALRIDPSIAGEEAYRLSVTPAQVEVSASSDRGLFWGVQTLRQLPVRGHGGRWQIPALRIEDAPAYAWRGAMLDVARHFFPVDYVERQIDAMAYYKLDVLHWHLTDDQGWRIRIDKYPKLTEVGAWRTEADGSRSGGFYTQAQIREVVEYARRRNIMVVPEIEMPGHTSAAIAAYPELSCGGKPIDVPATWGVFRNVDCVGKDATFAFLQDVLDEVIALFPSPYVHIGGDEVPEGVWNDCRACAQLAAANGFKADEQGLHGYFVGRIQKYLASKGKTLVGWDEILEGGVSPQAIAEIWHLPSGAYGGSDAILKQAFANGNRVIIAGPFYFDTPIDDMTLQDIYRTDAFAGPVYAAHRAQVLGAEAPLWAEHVTPLNGEAMLYPRLMAFAERLWNPDARDYADFDRRVQAQYPWLAAQGIAYGPEDRDIVDYRFDFNPMYLRWRVRADRGFDDLQMHYTTDGSEPTARSPWFSDVLDLYAPTAIRVAPFRDGVQRHASAQFVITPSLALGKPVTFATPPSAKYSGALNDGILGSDDFDDRAWAGWQDADMDAVIDLQQPTTLHGIDLRFLQVPDAWILLPREASVAVSDDGKRWKTLQALTLDPDPDGAGASIHDAKFRLPAPVTTRYVRVVATRYGKPVAGDQTWLFCDEITVR